MYCTCHNALAHQNLLHLQFVESDVDEELLFYIP